MQEPTIRVGIMYKREISFQLNGTYTLLQNNKAYTGKQSIKYQNDKIAFDGLTFEPEELIFIPKDYVNSSFELFDVTIGINFHWERKENQSFKGSIHFICEDDKLTAINVLKLEDYLVSVISSEMKATSSLELLKAHAIISRSWLLAQVLKSENIHSSTQTYQSVTENSNERIKWYDREDHQNFDVCADDHCQRYQGITKQSSHAVIKAIETTRGIVLTSDGNICDARFSKCCGGISETFENVWEPKAHKYLQAIRDGKKTDLKLDLKNESTAKSWILSSPDVFCNTIDKTILSQILNDYDMETPDFFRWKVRYTQDDLSELINRKTEKDFGKIIDLIPIERGLSGRIIKLKIVGEKMNFIIGKELEIRKVLSESHLYSSNFILEKEHLTGDFILKGAGWGHGVGLCQIGAAVMGANGYSHKDILLHYFTGAELEKRY
ncbi:SpoIID/LytB domain-containing protein [Ancylomarina sp. 16SWW S1-10-2]|uniref:SpoIID/LytB domain-containing protein n=1 Tax=Ancylomarina sp. 16SWW S1-10-2 TaxID=2499681 RepID=UPI0012AD929C|nr:SpoIID/LytB domain-containing protein [Ancylomarina sp. 16SWW S1-10-2]MRT94053.1 SpoIID/LytB domain-containing protein [Ancylomarina sp. 16SWW S1-10-2]